MPPRTTTHRAPRVHVEVTLQDIENAKRRDSAHCMIAEAIKRAYAGARRVSVDLQAIRFTDPQHPYRYEYLTPSIAQLGIIAFDQGDENIEPITFDLANARRVTRSSARSPQAGPPMRRGNNAPVPSAAPSETSANLTTTKPGDITQGITESSDSGMLTEPVNPVNLTTTESSDITHATTEPSDDQEITSVPDTQENITAFCDSQESNNAPDTPEHITPVSDNRETADNENEQPPVRAAAEAMAVPIRRAPIIPIGRKRQFGLRLLRP